MEPKCFHSAKILHDERLEKQDKVERELSIKSAHFFGPTLESKFQELKDEICMKIQKEMTDSANTRDFMTNKYAEICNKIKSLSELDATVTGFRSDIRAVEKQVAVLVNRVDHIEKQVLSQDNQSMDDPIY